MNRLILFATFAGMAGLVFPVTARSQTTPTTPAGSTPIKISPFTVTENADVGYLAPDTLAGSRMNTSLKDLASSISVFTEEFLSDLGATDLTSALGYANNVEFELNDSANNAAPNNNVLVTGFQAYRVRGLPATRAVNFFEWEIPLDTYNISRIEDARGPNSVLFGIAQAGGLINSTTKQPLLGRSFRKVSAVYSSHSSLRGTFDVNQVALDGKLAVRVNALHDDTRHFRRYMFDEDQRVHVGLKYQVTPATAVRVEYEAGNIKGNVARPFNLTDGVLPWLNAGRPRLNTPVANAQAPAGTVRLAATARVTYIANTGQLLNMAQQMTTNGSSTIIQNPAITDRSINVSGPGTLRTADFSTFSAFVDHKLGRETYLEFAYNRQRSTTDARDPTVSSSDLKGDPNNFLPGGAPNPNAGGLLLEAAWFRTTTADEADTWRGMLASEHDAGRWGKYRFALMGEHRETRARNSQQGEFWAGAPFHANPENGANQVWRRFYVTEGDWGSYRVDGDLQSGPIVNLRDPISGRTLSSSWIPRQQGSGDVPTTVKSFVAGLQPRFFDGRLVGNLGYRVDQLETIDRNDNVRDPATSILVVDYVNGLGVDFTGETRTYGVVGHLTRNLSLLGNYATNLGLPNPRNSIIPGRKAPARTGQGKDVGFALSLLDGRLYARAVYYETAGQNLTGTRGIFALNTTNTMVLDALTAAGAITAAQAAARSLGPSDVMTYDLTSEGYEFQLTANLTRNWRLIANFSSTEASEQNVGNEVKPWIADNFAFWRTFNQSLVTSRGLTIAQELVNITNTLDEQFETEGDVVFGNRRHKVNLFTRYGFSSGPLRGLSLGAGYRHQSKIVIGRTATGNVHGNSFYRVDAMLGYQVRGLPRDLKLGVQLNVTNVLDEQAPLILRYQGVNVRRYALSAGREWRLSANLDF